MSSSNIAQVPAIRHSVRWDSVWFQVHHFNVAPFSINELLKYCHHALRVWKRRSSHDTERHGCGVAVVWTAFPSFTRPSDRRLQLESARNISSSHSLIIARMPFAVLGGKTASGNDAEDPDHKRNRDVADPVHGVSGFHHGGGLSLRS